MLQHDQGQAGVAKLVNAPDLESGSMHRIAGSNPAAGTTIIRNVYQNSRITYCFA